MTRSQHTLTAWVAETAAQVDGRDAADMVLIFSALQTAAKQIAFAVSQVCGIAAVSHVSALQRLQNLTGVSQQRAETAPEGQCP